MKKLLIPTLIISLLILSGCNKTPQQKALDDAEKAVMQAEQQVEKALKDAEEAVEGAAGAVEDAAENAADAVEDAAENLKKIEIPSDEPEETEEAEVAEASGESAEVILAQCLTENGVKLYAASWCGHCQDQKAAFKDGLEYLDHTECAVDEGWAQDCSLAGVKSVPTWIFPDGNMQSGNTPLTTLAEMSGCTYTT